MTIILWMLGLGFVIAVIDQFTGRNIAKMPATQLWSILMVIGCLFIFGSIDELGTIFKYVAYFFGACMVLFIGVAVYFIRHGDLGGSVDEEHLKRLQESKFKD